MTPLAVSGFGCDPNDGVSLHTACRHGNLGVVKILIDHGANVEFKA
jgi:ankyrin repeat protein